MTTELEELKRLAEGVIKIQEGEIDAYTMGALTVKARFYDATKPNRILSFIARLEATEARVKVLEEALKPFATHAQGSLSSVSDDRDITLCYSGHVKGGVGHCTAGHLRIAARVHAELAEKEKE